MQSSNKGADLRQGKDHYTSHSRGWVKTVKREARKAIRRMARKLLRRDPDDATPPVKSCDYWS